MKTPSVFLSALFLLTIAISSCRKDTPGTSPPPGTFADELRASPDSLAIGTNLLKLDAYVYRNFMPVSEGPSAPLICINKLHDPGFNAIDTAVIHMLKQHVIIGDSVWTQNYEELHQNQDFQVEGIIRTGPLLAPGTQVDVICEFEFNGIIHRLRRLNLTVEAVY